MTKTNAFSASNDTQERFVIKATEAAFYRDGDSGVYHRSVLARGPVSVMYPRGEFGG